jgi:predicted metal-dependent HD superfamily phosphohydrolase
MPEPDGFARSWRRAWQGAGGAPDAELFERLFAAWSEPQRHYHTLQHLGECIAELEPALALAEHAGEVELALWFHDAVYDVARHDNEQRSAEWLRDAARSAGIVPPAVERLHALVMATRHDALPATRDAMLLVDVDLSILGAPPARFDEYERQVRAEYAWVPEPVFRERRKAVLEGLLARPRLYATERFHTRLEDAARANLRRSISQLSS